MRAILRLFTASIYALPIWAGLLLLLVSPFASSAQEDRPLVVVAEIDGAITPYMARYIDQAVERAEDKGAVLLVIEMNTPGGLGSAMDDIIDDIIQSKSPVAVYVSPINARAASAGVYITYASHIAVMAPSTNIGSASPIMSGTSGNDITDRTLSEKMMNDAIARITNLAQLRGRNVEWAVKAVKEADNITSQEALDIGVIDLIEPDLDALLADVNGRQVNLQSGPVTLTTANARIDRFELSLIGQFLQLLADPTLAYLLVSFGMLGLYIELSHPGVSVPGIFGGIALLLGLLGLGSLPVAWVGLALMALAFGLFILDLFVPSFGLITIGGLLSFIIGSNILIGEGSPEDLQVPREITYTMTACIAAAAALIGLVVLKGQFRRTRTGKAGMVGQVGIVRSDLNPSGMVLVFGEHWSARAIDQPIPAGEHVTVERVDGLRLEVRPATAAEIAQATESGDRRAVVPVR
jgi:membrane-bound serine protease (ClpP class)